MLRISQLKLNYRHGTADFMKKLAKQLRLPENEILEYRIVKRSVDARKKDDICFIYTVDAAVKNEAAWLKKHRNEKSVTKAAETAYTFPKPGEGSSKASSGCCRQRAGRTFSCDIGARPSRI